MMLKEVCEKTGLTKRTVRFYEEQGLIAPHKTYKNGREYRSYSDGDISRLQDIATLRRARFSIQEIKQMDAQPEDIPEVFKAYREGLYRQQAELSALIQVVEPIEELTSTRQLIGILTEATKKLPLPTADVKPHFRYLDEQEDVFADFRKRKATMHKKRIEEDFRIGVHTAMTAGATYKKGCSRSLDLGNEQKLAVMQLLRDDWE